jgi:hypothetical protein
VPRIRRRRLGVERFRPREVLVEFTDGTRLFVDVTADSDLEISIADGFDPDNVGIG